MRTPSWAAVAAACASLTCGSGYGYGLSDRTGGPTFVGAGVIAQHLTACPALLRVLNGSVALGLDCRRDRVLVRWAGGMVS